MLDRMTGSRDYWPPKSARALSVPRTDPDTPGLTLSGDDRPGQDRAEPGRGCGDALGRGGGRRLRGETDRRGDDRAARRRLSFPRTDRRFEASPAAAVRCGAARRQSHLVHLLTDFHLLLASMARNQFLRGFVETLASTTSLAVLLYDQSEAPSHAVAEHRELVQLLEQGKGAAASALMLRHLGRNQQRQERSPTGGIATPPFVSRGNRTVPREAARTRRACGIRTR